MVCSSLFLFFMYLSISNWHFEYSAINCWSVPRYRLTACSEHCMQPRIARNESELQVMQPASLTIVSINASRSLRHTSSESISCINACHSGPRSDARLATARKGKINSVSVFFIIETINYHPVAFSVLAALLAARASSSLA